MSTTTIPALERRGDARMAATYRAVLAAREGSHESV